MNPNAMTKPSSIKVTKTSSGAIPANVGFSSGKGEATFLPLNEQLESMERNGFTVEKTLNGILITPSMRG